MLFACQSEIELLTRTFYCVELILSDLGNGQLLNAIELRQITASDGSRYT